MQNLVNIRGNVGVRSAVRSLPPRYTISRVAVRSMQEPSGRSSRTTLTIDTTPEAPPASPTAPAARDAFIAPSSPDSPPSSPTRGLTAHGPGGSLLGGMALVMGGTVGGGILAIPPATVTAGFLPSASVLVGCWVLLTVEALLLAEVNISVMERERKKNRVPVANPIFSITEMAKKTLGDNAATAFGLLYLLLDYTLLTAYVAKGGEEASLLLHGLPSTASAGLFAVGVATLVAFGGKDLTRINAMVTTLVVFLFLGISIFSASIQPDWSGLSEAADWLHASECLPVLFMALVYHDCVPTVCAYQNYDRQKVSLSVVLGSLVPLVMLLLWEAVNANALGRLGGPSALVALAHEFDHFGAKFFGLGLEIFSLLAVATSATCTAIALTDYLNFEVGKARSNALKQEIMEAAKREHAFKRAREDAAANGLPVPEPEAPRAESAAGASTSAPLYGMVREALTQAVEAAPLPAWLRSPQRLACVFATFAPPLWLAADTNHQTFLTATSIAGGYCDSILYGILPVAMCYSLRRKNESDTEEDAEAGSAAAPQPESKPGFRLPNLGFSSLLSSPQGSMVPGGMGVLLATAMGGLSIGLGKLAQDLGLDQSPAGLQPNEVLGVLAEAFDFYSGMAN